MSIGEGLLDLLGVKPTPEPEHLYRAVPTAFWGIGDGVAFVTGVALERISPLPEGSYDPIFDEISEAGTDAQIELPEEGLVLGATYRAHTWHSTDWETGYADDWGVILKRIAPGEEGTK